MKAKKLFLKDVRDYLSEATEYDIKRIGEIFDRYCVTVVKNEITILRDNRPYAEEDAPPLPRVAAPTEKSASSAFSLPVKYFLSCSN